MPSGLVLVTFAVPEEARPFRRLAPPLARLLVTGMGRHRARLALDEAVRNVRPTCVITCGFAGGINPRWKVGDLLAEADPDFPLAARLAAVASPPVPARIHCADRVAARATDKAALFQETGADAVEMESGAIRARCRELDLPSATLRVISDAADMDLPVDFNALMTADQRLSAAKFAWHIVCHPTVIPGLMRLQKHCAHAAHRLAEALDLMLREPAHLP